MIKYFIPQSFKQYISVVKNRLKYRQVNIDTPYIGENVIIEEGCSINRDVIIMNNCSVDKYSYINFGSKIGYAQIGKFCSIGNNCEIGMHSHPINYISTSPRVYGKKNILNITSKYNEFKDPTIIGNDVWIGSSAIIMQGVNIGNGAIIGAGAVVTKDVLPYEIVGGVPAKHIRFRFSKDIIAFLENLCWWNLNIKDSKEMKQYIEMEDSWINYII